MSWAGWKGWKSGNNVKCPGIVNHLPKHITDSYWKNPSLFGKLFSGQVFVGQPGAGGRGRLGSLKSRRLRGSDATSPAAPASRVAPWRTVASTTTPQAHINKAGSESRIDVPS